MTYRTEKLQNFYASNIIWADLHKGYKIDQRLISKYFSQVQQYWLPLLMPFETNKPEKYYLHEVYEVSLILLKNSFDNNLSYLKSCLAFFANEIDTAYAGFLRISQSIQNLNKLKIKGESRFRQHIFPIYLELIEAVWRALARFYIIALEKPTEIDFDQYSKYQIREIENKLDKKHKKNELLSGFDRVLRNNIAHHKTEFSDDVSKKDQIILHDPVEKIISDREIDNLLIALYDNCSAMLYCLLKYVASKEKNIKNNPFGHYIRSQILHKALENRYISIKENTFSGEKNDQQRNLQIQYEYPCDIRALMFAFYALKLAVVFLRSNKYFISIEPKKGVPYLWILTEHERAVSFTEDHLGIPEYFKTGDVQIFRKKNTLFRKPLIPMKIRIIPQLASLIFFNFTRELQYRRGWVLIHEYNFSTGISGRYEMNIVQLRMLSHEEIKKIINKTINKKRALLKNLFIAICQIFIIVFKKKFRAKPPTNVVIVKLWKKEKRLSQMNFHPQLGNTLCVCCAEWNQDKHFKLLDYSKDDEIYRGITIRWFNIKSR